MIDMAKEIAMLENNEYRKLETLAKNKLKICPLILK